MKKYKDIGVYDFSDYAEEITGDALFEINGGAEVENSHEGVAGANVGDTITRKDGTVVTLKQADIDYAQKQLGDTGNASGGNAAGGSSGSGQGNTSGPGSSSTSSQTVKNENKWTFNPNEPDTDKRYNAKEVKYKNKTLYVMTINCDDAENFESFLNYYVLIGKDGAAGTTVYDGIGLMDKNGNVIQVLEDEKSVCNYARSLGIKIREDNSYFVQGIAEILGGIAIIVAGGISVAKTTVKNPKSTTTVGYSSVMVGTAFIGAGFGRITNKDSTPLYKDIDSIIVPALGSVVKEYNKLDNRMKGIDITYE